MAAECTGLGVGQGVVHHSGEQHAAGMAQKARATWMMLFCWGLKVGAAYLDPLPVP